MPQPFTVGEHCLSDNQTVETLNHFRTRRIGHGGCIHSPSMSQPNHTRAKAILVLLVLALAVAIFHPVGGYAFLNWDDDIYLQNNPRIRDGITVASLEWAFTANLTHFSKHAEYWAPITLLTRLVDAHFFGIAPGAMHVTSVAIHVLNALLLAFALNSLTGAWRRSCVVALLFLVHPQNIEPALWLSARKDLVSATFLFLTLLAYARYARAPGRKTYGILLLAFVGALMAKPMAVTVPVLLLILDAWPLNRWKDRQTNIRLIAEKLPLFLLAAIAAGLAVLAQIDVGAMGSYSWGTRITNAIYATATYVRRTVWADDLCIFYPHTEGTLSTMMIVGCGAFLVALTSLAVWQIKRRPFVAVGWFWFVVGLAPVIGLIQVGRQAMADRYFYTTGIGLFIVVVWSGAEFIRSQKARRILGSLSVVLLTAASVLQVRHWRDSGTAFARALKVTEQNYIAHGNLASHLFANGDVESAKTHILQSLSIQPLQFTQWNNLGAIEASLGRIPAAIHAYERAVLLDDKSAKSHFHLGRLLAQSGRKEAAIPVLQRAVELAPSWTEPAKLLSELRATSESPASR